jgi:plasmid maintenance system killer protein
VIRSFRGRQTEKVWSCEYSKRIPRDIQERALMKLQQLNAAGDLKERVQHSDQQAMADLFQVA